MKVEQYDKRTTPGGNTVYRAVVVAVTTRDQDEIIIGAPNEEAPRRAHLLIVGSPLKVAGERIGLFEDHTGKKT